MLYGASIKQIDDKHIQLGGFPSVFRNHIRKLYGSSKIFNLFDLMFSIWSGRSATIHNFFVPELMYIFSALHAKTGYKVYSNFYDLIKSKTWMKSIDEFENITMNKTGLNDMNITLRGYQKDFLDIYVQRKRQYNLNGYILSFEQGLGKTITSLALMECLNKDSIIIVCPKSLMRDVWFKEINKVFKSKQLIYVHGYRNAPTNDTKWFIYNYESLDKVAGINRYLAGKQVGVIVDESHNFKNFDAVRTRNLSNVIKTYNVNDLLMMSGTPVKGLVGKELVPYIHLLDPMFDTEARTQFIKIFSYSSAFALEILKNRLGFMMHRVLKTQVEDLPEKHTQNIKVKIPHKNQYTLTSIKNQMLQFMEIRKQLYKQTYNIHTQVVTQAHNYVKDKLSGSDDWNKYMKLFTAFKRGGKPLPEDMKWVNLYEKNNVEPLLPSSLRKQFRQSKSVIKYVNLKIYGEALGYLQKRRVSMYSDMLQHSGITTIINKAKKKTILFTTSKHILELAEEYCKGNGYNPAVVSGDTSNIPEILEQYRNDPVINPLIAMVQVASTGITLLNANTIIFLNLLWRDADRRQAVDRVHRIGQDTDVYIYNLLLDTGEEENLSTRMDDILNWSRDQFVAVTGDDDIKKLGVLI